MVSPKLRAGPIVRMLAVCIAVTGSIIVIYLATDAIPALASLTEGAPWVVGHLVHIPQFLIPFIVIWHISRSRLDEFGFNLKQDRHLNHIRVLKIGLLIGLAVSLRYVPQLVSGVPVAIPRPVTPASVVGRMTFQWIVVGVTEETMFRGLIQTYLMKKLEGYVRIANHDFHIGTVLGACFWGGFHFINVLIMPLGTATFLVIVTTVIGLVMGYAYQRTGSLLTTIIMHNTIFGVPLTIGYLLNWML
jgi:membrane protease YdiL (CAAX protease family)